VFNNWHFEERGFGHKANRIKMIIKGHCDAGDIWVQNISMRGNSENTGFFNIFNVFSSNNFITTKNRQKRSQKKPSCVPENFFLFHVFSLITNKKAP
jgi:hypothetical protein